MVCRDPLSNGTRYVFFPVLNDESMEEYPMMPLRIHRSIADGSTPVHLRLVSGEVQEDGAGAVMRSQRESYRVQ